MLQSIYLILLFLVLVSTSAFKKQRVSFLVIAFNTIYILLFVLFFYFYVRRNSVLHYVKTVDIQCFTQDKNKGMKQKVQRKKLEDIVRKLKQTGNSNINN